MSGEAELTLGVGLETFTFFICKDILTLSKKVIICSKNKNRKIFEMTIGGFCLTGFIFSAKIKLKKVCSIYMNQKITEFK